MEFKLEKAVPWGRNLEEYQKMFSLSNEDLDKNIISFGDGPASFNAELNSKGKKCTSVDLIYQFSKNALKERFEEVKDEVMKQVRSNVNNFTWKNIANPDELERLRMASMDDFLKDFDLGKKENRYIYHELPNELDFKDQQFELGLSSHFLLLYPDLGLDFHIKTINEMLRICKEIRIFPILNLNAEKSEVLEGVMNHFERDYLLSIEKGDYEFQKDGNELLKLEHKKLCIIEVE